MSLMDIPALELSNKIKSKEVKVVEAVRECLDSINADKDRYNCFISVDEESAIEQANYLQEQLDNGSATGDLFGVPIAVKDNICVKGMRATCGSKMLKDFYPCYSATAVTKLKNAGIIVVGKTNMDEFAMGSTSENSYFGPVRNPWNLDCVAGGSSGGSGAAVAAREVPLALGSDTGGSVRQPAAFCGVVGIKPTYGAVSRYGLISYASSFDQIGTMAKTVADAGTLLAVISGYDEKDSTSRDASIVCKDIFVEELRGVKIGVPVDLLSYCRDKEIIDNFYDKVNDLRSRGAMVEEFSLGMTEYCLPAYYIIASAEASSNLERYDGVKYGYREASYENLHDMYKKTRTEGFGREVKRRIMLGTFVLSEGYYDAYYMKALKAKAMIKDNFNRAFEKYQAILTPVTPSVAYPLNSYEDRPVDMYQEDIFTVWANLAGIPSMSVPSGLNKEGMPMGIQIMSAPFREQDMLKVGYAIEKATPILTPFVRGGAGNE